MKALISEIGGRPDVVIDSAGGDTFNNVLDVVKPGGRVVSYGATTGADPEARDSTDLLEAAQRARQHDGNVG